MKFFLILILLLICMPCSAFQKYPGTSIANAVLQKDTTLSVLTSAYMKSNDCEHDFSITNTELLSTPQYNKVIKGVKYKITPWYEEWTVNACGKNIYVPIKFIPEEKGTTFVIQNKDIHY